MQSHSKPSPYCPLGPRTKMAVVTIILTAIIVSIAVGTAVAFLVDDDGHVTHPRPILVAAFNIRQFGVTKMSREPVVDKLVEIIRPYDVILIQEVVDKSGAALQKMWTRLNTTDHWGLVISDRLGRSSHKEEYAFFYKPQVVNILNTFQYDDSSKDVFEREPFSVEVEYHSLTKGARVRVVLMGLHVKPADADVELAYLPGVMRSVYGHFQHTDGLIAMGDFNADCSYLNGTAKRTLEIFRTDGDFVSLFPETLDTTVAHKTDCAYDRAIVLGKDVMGLVGSPKVFAFDAVMGLNETFAQMVSDHYPIEFVLN